MILGLALAGCGGDRDSRHPGQQALRVIVRPDPVAFLPRQGEPVDRDREVARGLAEWLDRRFEPVVVEDYPRMIDALLAGEGDLIAASLSVTDSRRERVAFSLPYLYVDELLVAPRAVAPLTGPEELEGLEVCFREETSYAETVADLRRDHPGIRIRRFPGTVATEEIVDRVARRECASAAVDSHLWAGLEEVYPDLHPVFTLRRDRPIAVALRPDHDELRRRVDEYLTEEALTRSREAVYREDLPDLQARRTLRMITRNNSMTPTSSTGAGRWASSTSCCGASPGTRACAWRWSSRPPTTTSSPGWKRAGETSSPPP